MPTDGQGKLTVSPLDFFFEIITQISVRLGLADIRLPIQRLRISPLGVFNLIFFRSFRMIWLSRGVAKLQKIVSVPVALVSYLSCTCLDLQNSYLCLTYEHSCQVDHLRAKNDNYTQVFGLGWLNKLQLECSYTKINYTFFRKMMMMCLVRDKWVR